MKKSCLKKSLTSSIRPCHHIGLFVSDLEKMTRFYVDKFGFALLRDSMIDAGPMKKIFGINADCLMRYLELKGLGLELFYVPQAKMKKRDLKNLGYHHWSFLVKDKDAFCRDLARQSVEVIQVPRPHGFTYFVRDPENNSIEIKSYQL